MGFSEDQERHRGQVETVREWAQTASSQLTGRASFQLAGLWRQTGEAGSQPAQWHRDAAEAGRH